ncbi:MAG: YafY family protein [Pseudomonadota bacterium]|nr:YafY family protein [Pseudomonadota bacterium]
MNKTERLFALIDAFRRHRRAVTAADLAQEMDVSVRTIYRDVQTLLGLGAPIDGEAGTGYLLRPGFFLPPLMFDSSELEALRLGARWVERQADAELARAASNAIAKIAMATPDDLRDQLDAIALYAWPRTDEPARLAVLPAVREAIRKEQKLSIVYQGPEGTRTERTIWPLVIAFYHQPSLGAWCELRQGYRTFRVDRIETAIITGAQLPQRRVSLFEAYLEHIFARPGADT